MAEGRPKHKKALERRLRNATVDESEFLRQRRQLANLAILQALASAQDQNGQPIFSVKGGVSMEVEFGVDARATMDLDLGFRSTPQDLETKLFDALAHGWDGFEFRIANGLEPIAETGSFRSDVRVVYEGSPLLTVRLEIGFAEGAGGTEVRMLANQAFDPAAIGLSKVGEIAAVTAAYAIAQKLHACTDRSHPTRENERSRDLIDVLTLWHSLDAAERANVLPVCIDIFERRGRQAWPPVVAVPPSWEAEYANTAKSIGFEPADVHQAASEVNGIIALIDGSNHRS